MIYLYTIFLWKRSQKSQHDILHALKKLFKSVGKNKKKIPKYYGLYCLLLVKVIRVHLVKNS